MRLMELVRQVAHRTGREPSDVLARVLSNWPSVDSFTTTQVELMAWLLNKTPLV